MAYNVPLSSINASDGNVTYAQGSVLRVGAGGNVNAVGSVVIDTNNNMGIGTPGGDYGRSWRLVARLDQNATTQFGVINGTVGISCVAQITKVTGTANSFLDWGLQDGNGSPLDTFAYGSAVLAARWTFGGAERMRITSAGSVGIGTNSPATSLDVSGSITTRGIVPEVLYVESDTGTTIRTLVDGSTWDLRRNNYSVLFSVSNATGTTLLCPEGGNLGVGNTTPVVKMHVVEENATTNTVTDVLRIESRSSGTPATGIGVGIEFATETSANNYEIGAAIEAVTTDVTSTSEDFDLVFRTMAAGAAAAERARITSTGIIQDSKGDVRTLVVNARGTGYTLVASDHGKLIDITTGGVTVPSGVFSAGQNITIYNDSASGQTITQGASVTLRLAGTASTGNRTLAQRGIATVVCVASNEFVISGAGLT